MMLLDYEYEAATAGVKAKITVGGRTAVRGTKDGPYARLESTVGI